jgi:hypothetical protein
MKSIVAEICRAKREARVKPALATELEIRRALSSRGVRFTANTFKAMLRELECDPDIITRRLLRYNGYSLRNEDNANTTQEQQEELSAEARSAGQASTSKHSILSKPAVAESEETLSRPTSTVRGVPNDGQDNPSDGSGPHYADKYWWSEI